MGLRGPKPRPLAERFWAKVQVTPGCWPWQGHVMPNGYGTVTSGGKYGKTLLAHRVSYEIHHGPIPEGLHIDHVRPRCSRRDCVNPSHLEAVTQKINNQRAINPWTHCKKNHPLTPDNIYVRSTDGGRQCRRCAIDRASARSRSKINV